MTDGDDVRLYSEQLACIRCGVSYPEITPRIFSFNSPHGACPACDGMVMRLRQVVRKRKTSRCWTNAPSAMARGSNRKACR